MLGIDDLKTRLALDDVGKEMHGLIRELYPICRSITGNGVRQTLRIIQRYIPLEIHEVPTGTQVFDWVVPKEWNIRDAYAKNARGERVIDFRKSNLHVMGYSVPVKTRMPLRELKEHLFSLPEHPDWIPFRNSFYKENWGFCLSHRQLQALEEGEYEICIDSTLREGSLTYGEYYVQGQSSDEIILSCHICHPSLCNDNLSGISLLTFLAKYLSSLAGCSPVRYSYRFLFLPVTIGAITWLARNESLLPRIKHGLVVTLVGDPGRTTYKKSRRGDAEIDRAMAQVLKHSGQNYQIIDFFPYGYDERQFCSPAFNLPVGCLMRTPHGQFPQYHSSGDDLEFVRAPCLADSLSKCLSALNILENNRKYLNLNPKCEPQLGRRGIYRALAEQKDGGLQEMALLWVLNLSDGSNSLLDIAERSGYGFGAIQQAAHTLADCGLLQDLSEQLPR
jgi:Uncharacterized protein conserved in bacteria with an aminopeptidase-like domain